MNQPQTEPAAEEKVEVRLTLPEAAALERAALIGVAVIKDEVKRAETALMSLADEAFDTHGSRPGYLQPHIF